MTAERERKEAIKVTEHVADEGNIPGLSSTSGLAVIALILLAGLGLMYVASMHGPSHVAREAPSSSR
jgi:hypothetical protein